MNLFDILRNHLRKYQLDLSFLFLKRASLKFGEYVPTLKEL